MCSLHFRRELARGRCSMMERVIRTVLSFKELRVHRDDDFVDRLSRTYTATLLILFACVVSTKQFVGEPISCWCPAHFTDSHRQYTNTICWISNTFYVPFEQRIPDDNELVWQQKRVVSYYQWIPLMLLTMVVFSLLPAFIWRFLMLRSGIDVASVMDAAAACQRASYAEIRARTVRYMINHIDRYLLAQRDYAKDCCMRIKHLTAKYCFLVGGKRHGNYLTVAYLLVKILYLINAIGQLFLLDEFLGIDYHMYGVQVIRRLLRGEDWTVSERFPRVTLCNFEIRHQARVHDYVVQCALSVNLFNEKIFVIIWFWYVFLAVVTAASLVHWSIRAIVWPAQLRYVKRHLRAYEVTHRSKANLRKFTQHYLRRDGIFLIRLISINIGEIVAAEVLAGLWENYGPDKRFIAENPTTRRQILRDAKPSRMDVI